MFTRRKESDDKMIIVVQVNAPSYMVKGVKESLAMYLERFGDTKVLAVCPENKAHEQTTIEGFNNGTKITEQAQAALVEMGRKAHGGKDNG